MRNLSLVLSFAFVITSAAVLSRSSPSESAPAVKVVVDCSGNPEKVSVKNQSGKAVTVTSVGSLYQPINGEPFLVGMVIGAARNNVLTKKYIFNNDVGSSEGARVRTSVGTFTDRCG